MSDRPWFLRWFGEDYLDLYPHRDRAEAGKAVTLLVRWLEAEGVDRSGWTAPGRAPSILDLACGAGRHLEALRSRGFGAVGLDLSEPLLQRARAAPGGGMLVRGDMRRLPFPDASFRMVTSFFTSFGYFDTEAEDRQVVGEIARVLRPEGHVLLDFLNAPEVRAGLRPRDVRVVDGREVVQERRLLEGGRRVEKEIRITRPGDSAPKIFTERVRLYELEELAALLEAAGLEPLRSAGDYAGSPSAPGSPRAILLARARS